MKFNKITKISISLIILGSFFRIYHLFFTGYFFDIIETQYVWGKAASELGILNFWKNYDGFFDYMPLSVVLEYLIYNLSRIFGDTQFYFNFLLKTLNLVTDIFISGIIFYLPKLIKVKTITKENRLLVSSIFYLVPSVWFVSNVWGQNDSLVVLLGLISMILLFVKNPTKERDFNAFLSGGILSISFWVKQQAILFVPVIYLYLLLNKEYKKLLNFTVGIIISTILSIAPFWLVNSERTIFVLQTVSNRQANTTNGANNFWMAIKKIGDSNEIILGGLSIEHISKILLVISGILSVFIFYKNFNKIKSSTTQLFENLIYLLLLINYSYFTFATKVHSRYLHIAIICSFLLLVFKKNFHNKLFIFTVFLANLGYFINQLIVFNSYDKNVEPKWVGNFFINQDTQTLIIISSWLIISSFALFIWIGLTRKYPNEDLQ